MKIIRNLSDLNKKILKSSFWILLGTVISKAGLLLATILIAKYITKTEYGEFGIIKSTINMFSIFAGLGLGLTATKYIAQYNGIDNKRVSRIIGLSNFFSISIGVIVLLFFLLFSSYLAKGIGAEHLTRDLQYAGFILFFSALNGLQNGILTGYQEFKVVSLNNIIASIISVFFQVLGASFLGLKGVLLGFGLNFFILYCLNFYTIRKLTRELHQYKILSKDNFKELRIIWSFSLPALMSGLMVTPVVWFTNRLLVLQPNGYEQMANFDIANQWRLTILFIPAALSQIALPMLASAEGTEYKAIFNKNILLNFIVSIVVVVPMLFLVPFILKYYGEDYSNAFYPLIIMMLTTILVAINNVIGQAIASLNKMWIGFIVNVVWGLFLVVFVYFFVEVKQLGVIGLCLAYFCSYLLHSLVQYIVYRNILK